MSRHLQRQFWSLYGRYVWDARNPPWKAAQVKRIVELLAARQGVPGESVLDAGCGTGDYALALAGAGFHVTGVDYAKGMLARARAKTSPELSTAVSFQQADLNSKLAFPDGCFDHAINISVLQVTAEPLSTLGELWRVLKPGGTLVLLHVPRSPALDLPLGKAIAYRIRGMRKRTAWRIALVAAKVWAERTRSVRYWTAAQLQGMLEASRFAVLSVDHGPPIVVAAQKEKHS